MSHRIHRVLFVLLVAALPLQLFAQSELGLSINTSDLSETEVVDGVDSFTIDFEESIGFGLSFNHYWTPAFSTELAAQGFGGDVQISSPGSPTFTVGEISAAAITGMGQFHFNRAGRFSPYLGGGIAFVGGEFEVFGEEPVDNETLDLDTEATWVAGLGVDLRITERVFVNVDGRYIRWSANPEGENEADDNLDLDPLLLSAGVKFRF